MDLVKLNEVTAEVIDYINEDRSKNKGLVGLIKLSESLHSHFPRLLGI